MNVSSFPTQAYLIKHQEKELHSIPECTAARRGCDVLSESGSGASEIRECSKNLG